MIFSKFTGIWNFGVAAVLILGLTALANIFIPLKKSEYTLKTAKLNRKDIISSALTMSAALLVMIPLSLLGDCAEKYIGISSFNSAKYIGNSSIFACIVSLVIIPAVSVEILHRYYLLPNICMRYGLKKGIVVSGLIYSVFYLDIFNIVTLLLLGITLGYIAEKTKSILLPIIFQMLYLGAKLAFEYYSLQGSAGGEVMGLLKITGLGLIFIGIAFSIGYIGINRLERKRSLSLFNITILLLISIIFVFSGIGITYAA